MEAKFDIDQHFLYIISKLLDSLSGQPEEISAELIALLENPDVALDSQHEEIFGQIASLLKDPQKKDVTKIAIQKRISLLRGSFFDSRLPSDVKEIIFSHFPIGTLARAGQVSKSWRRLTLPCWETKLMETYGIDPNIFQRLKRPHYVFQLLARISSSLAINEDCLADKLYDLRTFLARYGVNTFCVCLDVEELSFLDSYFKSEIIPDLNEVARLGNLTAVKYFIETQHILPTFGVNSTLWVAATFGSMPIIRYLIDDVGVPVTRYQCSGFPKDEGIVKFFENNYGICLPQYTNVIARQAAASGSISSMRSCDYDRGGFNSTGSMNPGLNELVSFAPLASIKYLIENRGIIPNKNTLDTAALEGRFDIVRYLIEIERISPDYSTLLNAAKSGSVTLVEYLTKKRDDAFLKTFVRDIVMSEKEKRPLLQPILPDVYILDWAATAGSLSLLKYLIEECQVKPIKSILYSAARSSSLTCVLYLINKYQFVPDKKMLDEAVKGINLALVSYLIHDKQIKPDQETLIAAGDHLFMLRYLIGEIRVLPTVQTFHSLLKYDCDFLQEYLENLGATPSRERGILGRRCFRVIKALEHSIVFDDKQNKYRQWWTMPYFRFFQGNHFIKVRARVGSGLPSELPDIDNLEVTRAMDEIMARIEKAGSEVGKRPRLHPSEQIYLQALIDIKIILDRVCQRSDGEQKATNFYIKWNKIVTDSIQRMQVATEFSTKPQRREAETTPTLNH